MAKIPCTYFQQGNCRRGDKCFYKIEKVAAPTKEPKRTNGPAPKKKASAKAAPCITQRYARIAKGKGLPKATKAMKEQCHRAVVFSSKVEYIKVPATGEQRKVVHRPRLRKAIQGETWYLKLILWSSIGRCRPCPGSRQALRQASATYMPFSLHR